TQIADKSPAGENRLCVGRSQDVAATSIHARLRDVRIYLTALTGGQIAAIHRSTRSGREATRRRAVPLPEISRAGTTVQWPLASRLSSVPDITVETVVGVLPHLPATVAAVYRDAERGPGVRVIWP